MTIWYWLADFLPFAWAHYSFMQNALLAILLFSPLFAVLGCLVINNQMAFFSEAIGHAALTGIAIGVIAGLGDPMWSMAVFAVFLAVLMSGLRRWSAASTDTIIGLIMAFCVALGVVILSHNGGFNKFSRYLIGDILTITPGEILRLILLLLVAGGFLCMLFNRLVFISINRSLASSRGLPVWLLETAFACLVAVTVTFCIPLLGVLVINSLLILPAAAARNMARNVPAYFLMAVVISGLSGVAGLVASFYWGTATGATIVLFAMALFLLSLAFRRR